MRVFSTSRALRNHYNAALQTNQFIDKAITIGELFSKIVLVPGRVFIDPETRLLLLAKASEFENFIKLQIERDLFSFLHNSDYIFRFFEELSGEKVSVDDIDIYDTYEEYAEHLAILKELMQRYRKLLDEHALTDPIFLPEVYELNRAYLMGIKSVEIELEGYLTAFEMELLQEASRITEVKIILHANSYNLKLQERFKALGFDLQPGYRYTLNLSPYTIESSELYDPKITVQTESFSERVLQVAFIKKKISEFVLEKKIDPADIVVILPSESFATTLALYDEENNFNFAMGLPFTTTLFMKRIDAIMAYFDHPTQEQKERLKRFMSGIEAAYDVMRLHYSDVVSMELFLKIVEPFCIGNEESVQKIINEQLFEFKKLAGLLEGSTFKIYLKLLMQRLASVTIDDVRGGKVTVMGVLETRGSCFDGVIVVDFNDSFVPKKSQKDLFLSSAIKSQVGLPTSKDREALQKYFYQRLFENASEVAISYVSGESQIPSKFLTELGIKKAQGSDEEGYSRILYEKNSLKGFEPREITAPYDFRSRPLSATGLKAYLSCKRKFYYNYVARLKGHEIPLDMPKESEVGQWLHALLEEVYTTHKSFDDAAALHRAIDKAFEEHKSKGEMGRYLVRLWLERLEPFYANEVERFKSGYRIHALEKDLKTLRYGITLTGKVDRIDTRDGMLSIIDYKSGSIDLAQTAGQVEKATDFQLEFYALLASQLGEVEDANYYELKTGYLRKEIMLNEKIERLDEILQELAGITEINFEMTEDKAVCRFCDYLHLCGRG